jgi:3-dehydroquinate synthase
MNRWFFNNFQPFNSIKRMPDNIFFSANPGAELKNFLNTKNYSKLSVLTDENTFHHCYPLLRSALPPHELIQVDSGEEHKNLQTCTSIWQSMTDNMLDRHSVMIVIGGGVLGDMGGFCAATYKRGIDFILIPTTLLAQVDASIGGKLGIDFNHFKNHIGVFQHPSFTMLHAGFLKTLPKAELRSGFAEIIKHALISDEKLWNDIKQKSFETQDWNHLIKHSVSFKSKVVTEDPKEKGLRKILNAGHTIGHALETYLLSTNNKVLHGEAIAAGLITEAFISVERGLLLPHLLTDISQYILRVFGKIQFAEKDNEGIAQLVGQDKKNKGNKVLCVLLEGIGKARWDCEISSEDVKRALSFYRSV